MMMMMVADAGAVVSSPKLPLQEFQQGICQHLLLHSRHPLSHSLPRLHPSLLSQQQQ